MSPGLIGFLATFAIVVATVLLMLDMVRRLRRLSFREDRARQQEAAAVPQSEHNPHPEAEPERPH